MTDQEQANIPDDIHEAYSKLGLLTERERQVFRDFAKVEPCFKWQIEPTGPISTRNTSVPYPVIRSA